MSEEALQVLYPLGHRELSRSCKEWLDYKLARRFHRHLVMTHLNNHRCDRVRWTHMGSNRRVRRLDLRQAHLHSFALQS